MLVITFNSLGVVVVKFCLGTATLHKSRDELPQQHMNTVHQNIIMGGFQFSLQNSRKGHPKVVSLQQRFPNVLLRKPLFCGRASLRTQENVTITSSLVSFSIMISVSPESALSFTPAEVSSKKRMDTRGKTKETTKNCRVRK